jgi:hypothetical protein
VEDSFVILQKKLEVWSKTSLSEAMAHICQELIEMGFISILLEGKQLKSVKEGQMKLPKPLRCD